MTVPNVNEDGFWEAAMDAVTVNGNRVGIQGRTAILDTGTTIIFAPAGDAEAVHDAIPGSQSDGGGGFRIPCNTTAVVALTFNSRAFSIDARDLVRAPIGGGVCNSGIAVDKTANLQWLVSCFRVRVERHC